METTQNIGKQNYPSSVDSYDTWPWNETGLFYNAPDPQKQNVLSGQHKIHTNGINWYSRPWSSTFRNEDGTGQGK